MVLLHRKEKDIIKRRIDGYLKGYRHNIALLGKPRVGKSTLLSDLLMKNFSDTNLLPVHINLFYVDSSNFARVSIHSILFNFLKLKNASSCTTIKLDELIFSIQQLAPATAEAVKECLVSSSSQRNPVKKVFSVIDSLISEAGVKPLIIIDNFCNFKKFPKRQLSDMTQLILTRNDCMFLFMSSNRLQADEILNNEFNLLFGKFEKIYVDSFSEEEAGEFIKNRTAGRLNAVCRDFLLELSGRNPYYLDIFCRELLRTKHDQEMAEDMFINIAAHQLSNHESLIFQTCHRMIEDLKINCKNDSLCQVLLLIAQGYTRRKELASFLKLEPSKVTSRLAVLLDRNIITRKGSFYTIEDKLFGTWLALVYRVLSSGSFLFQQDFSFCIENMMIEKFRDFKSTVIKTSFDRFIDLMSCFNDDTVSLKNKSLRLPHIQKYRVVPASSEGMKFIIAEAKQTYILMAFKENCVCESDVIEFSNRCSYFKSKQLKKIFVSMERLDQNVKLLAKEKKLTCWNKNDLNSLLNLYCQPELV